MNIVLRRSLMALAVCASLALALGACTGNDNGGVINPPGPSSTSPGTTSSVP